MENSPFKSKEGQKLTSTQRKEKIKGGELHWRLFRKMKGGENRRTNSNKTKAPRESGQQIIWGCVISWFIEQPI